MSDQSISKISIERRAVFGAGLSALSLLAFAADATAADVAPMPSPRMPEQQSQAERANLMLLAGFFEAWRQGADAALLGRFLASDCVVRLGPPYAPAFGRTAAIELFAKVVADGSERRMIIDKTQSFGPVVLNLRSTTGTSPLIKSRASRVVGVFAFAGSEIRDWTDHVVPAGMYFI